MLARDEPGFSLAVSGHEIGVPSLSSSSGTTISGETGSWWVVGSDSVRGLAVTLVGVCGPVLWD